MAVAVRPVCRMCPETAAPTGLSCRIPQSALPMTAHSEALTSNVCRWLGGGAPQQRVGCLEFSLQTCPSLVPGRGLLIQFPLVLLTPRAVLACRRHPYPRSSAAVLQCTGLEICPEVLVPVCAGGNLIPDVG